MVSKGQKAVFWSVQNRTICENGFRGMPKISLKTSQRRCRPWVKRVGFWNPTEPTLSLDQLLRRLLIPSSVKYHTVIIELLRESNVTVHVKKLAETT